MELCLITPTKHIDWMRLLPGRFCLANIKDEQYLNAFREATKEGYDVVLDNGAFEDKLVDANAYLAVARDIQPSVIVAPDLMNAKATSNLTLALDFAARVKASELTADLMFVPQCERNDISGYADTLRTAIQSGLFKWIGVCRNSCFNAFGQYTHTLNENLNKFYFGVWAERNGILSRAHEKGIRFHLLGVGGDIFMLQYLWWADRADTASLFYQATLGERVSTCGVLSSAISRPPDYFRRNFEADHLWRDTLTYNCQEAQVYATAAKRKRYEILKDRI